MDGVCSLLVIAGVIGVIESMGVERKDKEIVDNVVAYLRPLQVQRRAATSSSSIERLSICVALRILSKEWECNRIRFEEIRTHKFMEGI